MTLCVNLIHFLLLSFRESPSGVVAKVLNCNLIVSKFKLKSFNCIYIWTNTLGKGINLIILRAMGSILLLLIFYKDVVGIE